MLEPWLGSDVELAILTGLPLILVTIESDAPPDFVSLGVALAADSHGAVL
jgi:hypothetical protein